LGSIKAPSGRGWEKDAVATIGEQERAAIAAAAAVENARVKSIRFFFDSESEFQTLLWKKETAKLSLSHSLLSHSLCKPPAAPDASRKTAALERTRSP